MFQRLPIACPQVQESNISQNVLKSVKENILCIKQKKLLTIKQYSSSIKL